MESPHGLDCMLSLSLPAELEEELIDLLREHPEQASGFTIVPAEGFGTGTRLRSSMEQVRGRSRRRVVQILLRGADVETLLDALRARMPSDEIAWWTMPLSGFGRFA